MQKAFRHNLFDNCLAVASHDIEKTGPGDQSNGPEKSLLQGGRRRPPRRPSGLRGLSGSRTAQWRLGTVKGDRPPSLPAGLAPGIHSLALRACKITRDVV